MPDELSDDDRVGMTASEVIQQYFDNVSIYHGPTVFNEAFSKLPEFAQNLFAVHWCDSEVCNGGFHQFFSNSSGVLALEAYNGLSAIGLTETAKIVRTAIAKFGEPYPRDRNERCIRLKAIELPGETRK